MKTKSRAKVMFLHMTIALGKILWLASWKQGLREMESKGSLRGDRTLAPKGPDASGQLIAARAELLA